MNSVTILFGVFQRGKNQSCFISNTLCQHYVTVFLTDNCFLFSSLSTSVTSCGSSYPASWISSVKRMASTVNSSKDPSSNADMSVEDIEGDETLAEETSSASNTISSNPSTSSACSLQRKISVPSKSKLDQNSSSTKKLSMVPRPTGRRTNHDEEAPTSPKKFYRLS